MNKNYNNNQHKGKWIATLMAFIILFIAVIECIGFNITGTWNALNWFTRSEQTDKPSELADNSGMIVTPKTGNAFMKLTALPLTASADDGITAYSDSDYTLTATITPDSATNKQVDWSLAWKNGSSSWANGKTVTSYVTITPTSDGALTANLKCLQAFGEKITVQCTSRDNPDASATCTLDYSQKIENVGLKFGNMAVALGGTTNVKFEVNPNGAAPGGATNVQFSKSSVYTLADNFTYKVYLVSVGNITGDTSVFLNLNGHTVTTGHQYGETNSLNNSGLYFDYAHDVSKFVIFGRTSDILFKNLSTAEIITYFSNITEGRMFYVVVDVKGQYSDYSANSLINCVGYTNQASVTGLNLNDTSIVL